MLSGYRAKLNSKFNPKRLRANNILVYQRQLLLRLFIFAFPASRRRNLKEFAASLTSLSFTRGGDSNYLLRPRPQKFTLRSAETDGTAVSLISKQVQKFDTSANRTRLVGLGSCRRIRVWKLREVPKENADLFIMRSGRLGKGKVEIVRDTT